MAKKNIDIGGLNRLFTDSPEDAPQMAPKTQRTHKTPLATDAAETETPNTSRTSNAYRINLKLDPGLRAYIYDASWAICEYLNGLIRANMAKKQKTG